MVWLTRHAGQPASGAADMSHSAADTATFTAFTSFLVFSAFLGAKKHFFQKVLKNGLVLKKIENIFITF